MRNFCKQKDLQTIDGSFEKLLSLDLPENIGGIWCAASLLHVPMKELNQTFASIYALLPSDAPFYFTVRLGEGAKWDKYDDQSDNAARFIQLFSENDLLNRLQEQKFRNIEYWVENSTWGRPSQWLSLVAVK